jgi:hypothetical protein
VKVANAGGIVSNFIRPSSSGIEGIATDVDNNVGLGQEHGPRAVAKNGDNNNNNNNNLQAEHTQVCVCCLQNGDCCFGGEFF